MMVLDDNVAEKGDGIDGRADDSKIGESKMVAEVDVVDNDNWMECDD